LNDIILVLSFICRNQFLKEVVDIIMVVILAVLDLVNVFILLENLLLLLVEPVPESSLGE